MSPPGLRTWNLGRTRGWIQGTVGDGDRDGTRGDGDGDGGCGR